MKHKLEPLSLKEKQETYGGWAWLSAALPSIITGAKYLATGMVAYKALSSTTGQFKGGGIDAKWDNENSSKGTKVVENNYYYAY